MDIAGATRRTYADFERQIPTPAKDIFERVREFCLKLGPNIVEDIRMHRIVFGKSLTFRWFADIEPGPDSVLIKIQRSRKEPPMLIRLAAGQDTDAVLETIRQAYNSIR